MVPHILRRERWVSMDAPALAIRQGVLPEPPDRTARLRCGSFAFRRLRRIHWRSSSSLYRLHCGLIPIETGRTGALRAGGLAVGLPGGFARLTNSAYPRDMLLHRPGACKQNGRA